MKVTADSERLIGAILLGNNVVNILSASLATALFTRILGGSGVAIATLVMTVLVLIFSEVMPKTYAISAPEQVASMVAPPIRIVTILLSPIVSVVRADRARHPGDLRAEDRSRPATCSRSRTRSPARCPSAMRRGAVHKEDRDRLLGALDLGNRTVEEIMRHRSEIEMIDAALPPEKILETVLASPHTRLPVFKDERENVVGVIHAKDLLRAVNRAAREGGDLAAARKFDVMAVAMPPYFVPETTALDEQMREFLKRRTHFALVVDEYGSIRGLITLEDIIEEIVGEIADEHDTEADQTLRPGPQGDYLIEGGMTIRDLNRQLDWHLPDDEANTVAGLVIHMAQSIPDQGQVFSFHGYRFEVVTRRENRITRLRVRPLALKDAERRDADG